MPRPASAYRVQTFCFTVIYIAINLAAIAGLFDWLSWPERWGLSVAIALPIAGQVWATLAFVHDSDEFVRAITAKRFILASGVAMALFSAWGFAESYAQAPHAPGWLVYVLFWGVYGLITPFVRSSH